MHHPRALDQSGTPSTNFRAYLWPEKPAFVGFLIMVSIYNFLKRSVLGAKGRVKGLDRNPKAPSP